VGWSRPTISCAVAGLAIVSPVRPVGWSRSTISCAVAGLADAVCQTRNSTNNYCEERSDEAPEKYAHRSSQDKKYILHKLMVYSFHADVIRENLHEVSNLFMRYIIGCEANRKIRWQARQPVSALCSIF